MKLSEAIRLGSMMGKQLFGLTRDEDDNSCALGAAELAAILPDGDTFDSRIRAMTRIWPVLTADGKCPYCNRAWNVCDVILCLNDMHHWPREKIADWVESIEPKEVEQVSQNVAASSNGKDSVRSRLEFDSPRCYQTQTGGE
jgi:hypothetical protein